MSKASHLGLGLGSAQVIHCRLGLLCGAELSSEISWHLCDAEHRVGSYITTLRRDLQIIAVRHGSWLRLDIDDGDTAVPGAGPRGLQIPHHRRSCGGGEERTGSGLIRNAGAGTTHHLTIELMSNRAGIKFLQVPYQGDAAALNALLGSQVQFTLATPTQAMGNIEAGTLRVLAVTGNTRSPRLPNVPTIQ